LPASGPTLRGEKDASHRLLQPTSLPSTTGLPDSRCTAAPRPPFDGYDARASSPWAETPRRQVGSLSSACRMSLPGGASLDGEPPASTIVAARRVTRWALAQRDARAASRGPGGVAIADSSARCLPAAALFAPSRACDIASDVLCRVPPRIERRLRDLRSPRFGTPRSASVAASSKATPSSNQDAFYRPSAPSPCRAGRSRACAWDHEEPATGLAARVQVAFATAIRLPTPVRWAALAHISVCVPAS